MENLIVSYTDWFNLLVKVKVYFTFSKFLYEKTKINI